MKNKLHKKGFAYPLAIFIIVVVILLFGIPALLNIFPEGELSCEIPYGGGSCSIPLNMPSGEESSLVNYALTFDSVAGTEFKGRTLVTPFAYGGPYTEEDDEQYDDSCKEDREITYVSLYRIPADFPPVYELFMEAVTSASGNIDETFSSVDFDLMLKYVAIPYPYTVVQVCGKEDRDDCSNGDYAIVHTWTDDRTSSTYGSYREDRVNIRDDVVLSGYVDEDFYLDDDYPLNVLTTQEISASGIVPHDAFLIEGMTQGNLALMTETTVDIENRCGVRTSSVVAPPQAVYLSYKDAQYPSNLKVKVGTIQVQSFDGEQQAPQTTYDVAAQINSVCNRGRNAAACDFELSFESDTGGKVIVNKGEEILRPVDPQDTKEFFLVRWWHSFVEWFKGVQFI